MENFRTYHPDFVQLARTMPDTVLGVGYRQRIGWFVYDLRNPEFTADDSAEFLWLERGKLPIALTFKARGELERAIKLLWVKELPKAPAWTLSDRVIHLHGRPFASLSRAQENRPDGATNSYAYRPDQLDTLARLIVELLNESTRKHFPDERE